MKAVFDYNILTISTTDRRNLYEVMDKSRDQDVEVALAMLTEMGYTLERITDYEGEHYFVKAGSRHVFRVSRQSEAEVAYLARLDMKFHADDPAYDVMLLDMQQDREAWVPDYSTDPFADA